MKVQDIVQKVKQYPVAFAFGAVAVLALVVLGLRYSKMSELDDKVAQLDDRLGKMRRNAINGASLPEDNARLKKALDDLQARLADPNTRAANLDYFYGLEKRSHVRLVRVQQNDPIPTVQVGRGPVPKFTPLTFSVVVEGRFSDIVAFIDLVQRDHFIVRMDAIRLNPAEDSAQRLLTGELSIAVLAPNPQAKS